MIIASRQAVVLEPGKAVHRTLPVAVSGLTSRLAVQLRLPTTAAPLAWDAADRVLVSLVLTRDGQEIQRATGTAKGGLHFKPDDSEVDRYQLTLVPIYRLGRVARDYMGVVGADAEGYYHNVPTTWDTEVPGGTIEAHVELELERGIGSVTTEILLAETHEAPAPRIRTKNSVAFDAASQATEAAGDGTVTVSHTASGSNRAATILTGAAASGTITGITGNYGATGTTSSWFLTTDVAGDDICTAMRYLVAPATTAQTAESIVGGTFSEVYSHFIGAVSFTGVDQTTPVGTSATAYNTDATATVTAPGVASDDMVVDSMITDYNGTLTIGADQTERVAIDDVPKSYFWRGSTQPGTAGGVMSWALGGSSNWGIGWTTGAVALKTVSGGTTFYNDVEIIATYV